MSEPGQAAAAAASATSSVNLGDVTGGGAINPTALIVLAVVLVGGIVAIVAFFKLVAPKKAP